MKKRLVSLLLACLMLCALLPAAVVAAEEPQPPRSTICVSERSWASVPDEKADNAELFAGFVKREMGKDAAKWAEKLSGAGEGLTGAWANVYEAMVPEIHKIAAGQRTSTEFEYDDLNDLGSGETIFFTAEELGVSSVGTPNNPCDEFKQAFVTQLLTFYLALKADLPFDLYWHDVTKGFYFGYNYDMADNGMWIEVTALYFAPCVDKDYRVDDSDLFTVNPTIGQRVETAATTARTIVAKYAGESDYEKLRAYNKEICDAVTYDYDAVEELNAGTIDHGDPWQLIWAFDNDPTTNIVCEGYSKAFQHLFDLSTFKNKIRSLIVTGDAGGGHMWNVVLMENGQRYLMDVTWSDGQGEYDGQYEAFFLKGADDGTYPKYKFYNSWRTYDSRMMALYGEEKLTLSHEDYVPGGTIAITTQPQDVTVNKGEEATFTVVATGENLTYQWYGRPDSAAAWALLDGETANALTVTGTVANNGSQYYCLLQDDNGELSTSIATLTVILYPPVITTQPQDVDADKGEEVTFTVEAAGADSYQWYGKAPADEAWTLLDGETKNTLTLVASEANNGWSFYCLLKNEDGEVKSDTATLTVDVDPPVITAQPQDVTVDFGAEATFTVVATGKNVTYQWYGRPDSQAEWTVLEGETAASLKVRGTEENNGSQYYCVLENKNGKTDSDIATLTVDLHLPTITGQPKNVKVKSGSKAKFTVKVKEKKVNLQWYARASEADEWTAVPNGTKATLTVVATGANNGWQYRCGVRIGGGATAYSNAATLTVTLQPPVIKTQPKSITIKSGAKGKFTVKASGKNLSYKWFSRPDANADWTEIAGETKATLTVTASMDKNGWEYYCAVQNADGAVDSAIVTLTVTKGEPVIKTQPKNVKVKSGSKGKFTVKASGKNLSYKWFSRPNADAEWTEIAGETKATLNIVGSMDKNGWEFCCEVQNPDGSVRSNAAKLTVTPQAPKISTQPKDVKAKVGAKATFKVKASPKNVTYQWYYRTSETGDWILIEGATSASYSFKVTEAQYGYQFRCHVQNADGEAWSKAATLIKK